MEFTNQELAFIHALLREQVLGEGVATQCVRRFGRHPRASMPIVELLYAAGVFLRPLPEANSECPWATREAFLRRYQIARRYARWPLDTIADPFAVGDPTNGDVRRRLSHPNSEIRMQAAAELGDGRRLSWHDVEALVDLLGDEEEAVANTVVNVLVGFARSDAENRQTLEGVLTKVDSANDPLPEVRAKTAVLISRALH